MAEASSTYEEASRCPKCEQAGEVMSITAAKSRQLRPGTTAHIIFCRNQLCRWLDTSWIVQVNPDGTVPPPNYSLGQPKSFPTMAIPDGGKRLVDNIQRQLDAETKPNGAEVRNPRG